MIISKLYRKHTYCSGKYLGHVRDLRASHPTYSTSIQSQSAGVFVIPWRQAIAAARLTWMAAHIHIIPLQALFAFYTGEGSVGSKTPFSLNAQVATSCCQAPLRTTVTRRCVAMLVLLINSVWLITIAISYKPDPINIRYVVRQNMLVFFACH